MLLWHSSVPSILQFLMCANTVPPIHILPTIIWRSHTLYQHYTFWKDTMRYKMHSNITTNTQEKNVNAITVYEATLCETGEHNRSGHPYSCSCSVLFSVLYFILLHCFKFCFSHIWLKWESWQLLEAVYAFLEQKVKNLFLISITTGGRKYSCQIRTEKIRINLLTPHTVNCSAASVK